MMSDLFDNSVTDISPSILTTARALADRISSASQQPKEAVIAMIDTDGRPHLTVFYQANVIG